MKKMIQWFKGLFSIGLILMFFSFFLDWYSFKIYSGSETTVLWGYNLFQGWISPISSTLNETLRPEDFSIQFVINIMLIGTLVISGYVAFFVSIENASSIEKYKLYSYVNGVLLLLVLCYILLFPIMYLLPNDLYFPLFHITNPDSGFTTAYSVGFGYVLQLFSFPLLFPYSIFYIQTVRTFEHEEDTVEKHVSKIIKQYQEPPELDKFIADEEAKT